MADVSYDGFALAIHHNKRSLKAVMFRYATDLLEMAVCCAKPPYLTTGNPGRAMLILYVRTERLSGFDSYRSSRRR
jgi:hypothetical protein